MAIELERLSFESGQVDYEHILFQALVNEGKHIKVLNAKRPQFTYNEKQLRDAAAAEVMLKLNGENAIDDDDGRSSTRKRKLLDPEEKVKQSRDRNREHAKNTRLRKKAYVTKLKELVDQMTRQKEIEERERRILGEKIYDTQVIRKNAVRLFLLYRSACVIDPQKWSRIVEENFSFVLPITPYRSFCRAEIENNSRFIHGIDGLIADCCSLALMSEMIGINTEEWKDAIIRGEGCSLIYLSDNSSPDNMLAAGELIMYQYILKTEQSTTTSDSMDACMQYGMLQCKFNKKNKIVHAEMMYDVMGYMQQLQKASAVSPEISIMPNTLDMALQSSKEARIVLKLDAGHSVLYVNDEWTYVTGLLQSDIEGKIFDDFVEIHASFVSQVNRLLEDSSRGMSGSRVAYYRINCNLKSSNENRGRVNAENNEKYNVGYFRAMPLTTDLEKAPTHLLLILMPLDRPSSKEDEEKCLSRHSCNVGAIATSSSLKLKEHSQNIESFESEYFRQILTFHNHYNIGHSVETASNASGNNTSYPNPSSKNFLYSNMHLSSNYPQSGIDQFNPYYPNSHTISFGENPTDRIYALQADRAKGSLPDAAMFRLPNISVSNPRSGVPFPELPANLPPAEAIVLPPYGATIPHFPLDLNVPFANRDPRRLLPKQYYDLDSQQNSSHEYYDKPVYAFVNQTKSSSSVRSDASSQFNLSYLPTNTDGNFQEKSSLYLQPNQRYNSLDQGRGRDAVNLLSLRAPLTSEQNYSYMNGLGIGAFLNSSTDERNTANDLRNAENGVNGPFQNTTI